MSVKRLILIFLICFPLWLLGQDLPFEVSAKTRYSQSGTLGYTTVDSLSYFQARLIQQFKVWKFKVGVDLDFLFDEDNHLVTNNWDHLEDYINKIYFLRYGNRDDRVFFHGGGFPGLTVGYGLIMDNYSNMRLYPEVRNTGAMLGFKPRWPGNPSFELFTSDVIRNPVMSFNLRTKPLPDSTLKVLDGIILGLSAVMDWDQHANLRYYTPDSLAHFTEDLDRDPSTALGLGYTIPLYESEKFTIGQYSEIAHILGHGFGMILPGVYFDVGPFSVNLEYKFYSDEYLPGYFGKDYEELRAIVDSTGVITKEDCLATVNSAHGIKGSVQALLFDRVKARVAWQNIVGEGLTTGKSLWLNLWVDTSYKRIENFSLSYNKTNASRLSLARVNDDKADFSFSTTIRLYKEKLYLIAKYTERYRDKDGDGHVRWTSETRRSVAIGARYVH